MRKNYLVALLIFTFFAITSLLTAAEDLISAGSQAGERRVITVKEIDYALRWCPAGEFMMGSPEEEDGRDKDEAEHQVTLSNGFWLLETEVTQEMWESVMGENPSKYKGKNLPVENVSWEDCQEFCKKLSVLAGTGTFRLPTEAQWEYACRAGTASEYGGTGDLDEMGWYDKNGDNETHTVKTKKASDWGLYDMHGNVWEWCEDWYGDYPSDSVTDPTGPKSGSLRVLRGGSWNSCAEYCHSSRRGDRMPSLRIDKFGFRLVLVP